MWGRLEYLYPNMPSSLSYNVWSRLTTKSSWLVWRRSELIGIGDRVGCLAVLIQKDIIIVNVKWNSTKAKKKKIHSRLQKIANQTLLCLCFTRATFTNRSIDPVLKITPKPSTVCWPANLLIKRCEGSTIFSFQSSAACYPTHQQ